MATDLLHNRRVLVVDDEPDVLTVVGEILSMCDVIQASTFEEAREALETEYFDIAILDIMGVDGYRLLEMANGRGVLAVMLTAHALSPEDMEKSFQEGAAFYMPKERLSDLTDCLREVLEAKMEYLNTWSSWMGRFDASFYRRFGSRWKAKARLLTSDGKWGDSLIRR